jgi:hypothetical protein
VVYRAGTLIKGWPDALERSKGELVDRESCVLKIVRRVYFLPRNASGSVKKPQWVCGSANCLSSVFRFETANGESRFVNLQEVRDLVVRAGFDSDGAPRSEYTNLSVEDRQENARRRQCY